VNSVCDVLERFKSSMCVIEQMYNSNAHVVLKEIVITLGMCDTC
jgi:hypothetical protein